MTSDNSTERFGNDPLDASKIDEWIDELADPSYGGAYVSGHASADDAAARSVVLVRALAAAFPPQPADEAALAEVWDEVANAALAARRQSKAGASVAARPGPGRRAGITPVARFGAPLRAIAAVLLVALLGTTFYALTRNHETGGAAMWQDVGISAARASGAPLDFDPAKGVTYVVNTSADGTIYACGQRHLWYSADGGQTYHPFTPALPLMPVALLGQLPAQVSGCALATTRGGTGVYAWIPSPDASTSTSTPWVIGYATAGASNWQVLAAPVVGRDFSVPSGTQADGMTLLWDELQQGGVTQVSGMLFVDLTLSLGTGSSTDRMLATSDFGTTWEELDTQLLARQQICVVYAVDPSEGARLFCLAATSPDTGATELWQSDDLGASWQQQTMPNTSVLRNPTWLFVGGGNVMLGGNLGDAPTIAGHVTDGLVWRPVAGGSWHEISAPQWLTDNPQSFTVAFDVAPDGTIYVAEGSLSQPVYVQAGAMPPGTTEFTDPGAPTTLPFNSGPGIAFGGTESGGHPAVYVSGPTGQSYALYRMSLPSA